MVTAWAVQGKHVLVLDRNSNLFSSAVDFSLFVLRTNLMHQIYNGGVIFFWYHCNQICQAFIYLYRNKVKQGIPENNWHVQSSQIILQRPTICNQQFYITWGWPHVLFFSVFPYLSLWKLCFYILYQNRTTDGYQITSLNPIPSIHINFFSSYNYLYDISHLLFIVQKNVWTQFLNPPYTPSILILE